MAKSTDIAIIQVCFNLLDPFQRRLYEHTSGHTNRSGYVKRLIQRDVEGQRPAPYSAPQRKEETAADDFFAEGFI